MAKTEEMNDYRSERKARIAKASKKKTKGGADSTKIAQIIIYVIAGLAVLAFVGWAIWYFGVPQRYMTAVTVGDRDYSYAEYSYYYSSVYQSLKSTAEEQEETYGFSLFDTTKSPDAQSTTDDDGNTITYAEYIDNTVKTTMEQTVYYLAKAEEAGIELNSTNKDEIDSTISSIQEYADQYGYSTSRYISLLYGKGLTEKIFTDLLTDQYIVSQYLEDNSDTLASDIPDEEIDAAFNEDPTTYETMDLRIFGFEISSDEDTDDSETTVTSDTTELEALANEFLGRITDEQSFITLAQEYCDEDDAETFASDTATLAENIKKSTVSSNISSDLADWLFDSARVAGDKTTVTTDSYVYVVYVIAPAAKNEDILVDARHILISFDNVESELEADASSTDATTDSTATSGTADDGTTIDSTGTGYSLDVVLKAYNEAHDILEEYAENPTEDNFADLAEEYSADTGSNEDGGLYTDIEKGSMVQEFEDWVYDSSRVPGDTGIIRTQYGYHVMYFVKTHSEAAWKEEVRAALAETKEEEFEEAAEAEYTGTAVNAKFHDYAAEQALALVNNNFVSDD